MVKTVGKYDLYGTLGEGAFGKVKYAVNTETNEPVAIKILDKDKIQARNMGAQIKKEISIMKMINHHHVVSVKDVFATSAKIFIVLEFVGGGELFDKIANEGKLPEDKARFYFKQLVEGLEHCHNQGICHRDLKPENLLLDTDGNLKISDFGFSTLNIGDADGDGAQRAELLHTTCGTPNYVAPEVLGKDGYDGKKADVWSCGVILYVLLAGYLPFDENTMAALFQKIKSADYDFPEWFTADARDLISKILVPDPHKRPRLADIKHHPWMLKGDSGPSPIVPINHAANMGVPAARQQAIQEHQQKQAQQQAQQVQAVPQPPAQNGHHHHHHHQQQPPSAPASQPNSNKSNPPPVAPISVAADRVNDQFSSDKAAIMSSPTNAAAQQAAAEHRQSKQVETPKEQPKPVAAPAPAPAPVVQQAPPAQKPVAAPAAAPAPVAQQPAATSNSRPASTQPPAQQQQPKPVAAPAQQARPAQPPQSNVAEVDSGLFCCGGRRVPQQTKPQSRPN